jgi:hypothetical protein
MMCKLIESESAVNWDAVTSCVAILLSIIALLVNRAIAQRNTRLTVQQSIFKTVMDKARDCNNIWLSEPEIEKSNPNSPHFLVITELIVSIETIEMSFSLFKQNYKSIEEEYGTAFYQLFYKQLHVDLRGWMKRTPQIAVAVHSPLFSSQVQLLVTKFERFFEPHH